MTETPNPNEAPKINLEGFFKSLFPEGFPQAQESCCGECPENLDIDGYDESVRVLKLAEEFAVEGEIGIANVLIAISNRYTQL